MCIPKAWEKDAAKDFSVQDKKEEEQDLILPILFSF